MKENYYYLKLNNKGVIDHKLFGNKKGMLTYIHEKLEETYLEYEPKILGNYQKFQTALKGLKNDEYNNLVKETHINIRHLEAVKNYTGEKNKEIYNKINK
jgi:hypothetical protein